jgi:Na+-transporting NADH:ubiquinone oxidoreductase subunit C
MSRERGTGYTLGFAAVVCVVCSILVSTAAVALRDRQDANRALDIQRNVLLAASLMEPGEDLTVEDIERRFEDVQPLVVDRASGGLLPDVDVANFDLRWESQNPETSQPVSGNPAGLARLPDRLLVYQILDGDQVDQLVLPVEGKGLWSTLYGFLALDADTTTIRGIAFYQHAETPGLGGEIDSPRWRGRWEGRKAFDDAGAIQIQVIKGQAGTAAADPHRVDGISGATLTGNGVSHLARFWLGDEGYGPYLDHFRGEGR